MKETPTKDRLLGKILGGRYLLCELLEARGELRRYRAESRGDGRPVIATVVHAPKIDRLTLEAIGEQTRALRALDHRNWTWLIDAGHGHGAVYGIEPQGSWHDLRRELEVKGRLAPEEACQRVRQLLAGLAQLHDAGLAHGGLCPPALRLLQPASGDDLVLQISSATRLCLAVVPSALPEATSYGRPPAARGPEAIDLHAAGLLLAQALTGRSPGPGEPRPTTDGVPANLAAAITRATAVEGEAESPFADAREMLQALGDTRSQRRRFGRYTVLRRLARGGMGEILLARTEGIEMLEALSPLCVLKTIRTSLAQNETFVSRFLAEARLLASLHHSNIVPVYDMGKIQGTFYIAMEYVVGLDLFQLLAAAGAEGRLVPLPVALLIAREVANGLAYAHQTRLSGAEGLVHRDVSPQNILLSCEGEVKLIDFGLARATDATRMTAEGTVLGKARYLSPEQARARRVDRRTDVYALGLVLYEMLTGEPFFGQPRLEQLIAEVSSPTPSPPSERVPTIPPEVDAICMRAMQPAADDRYDTAEALRDDLTVALAGLAPRSNPEAIGEVVCALFHQAAGARGSDSSGERGSPTCQPADDLSMRSGDPAPIRSVPTTKGRGSRPRSLITDETSAHLPSSKLPIDVPPDSLADLRKQTTGLLDLDASTEPTPDPLTVALVGDISPLAEEDARLEGQPDDDPLRFVRLRQPTSTTDGRPPALHVVGLDGTRWREAWAASPHRSLAPRLVYLDAALGEQLDGDPALAFTNLLIGPRPIPPLALTAACGYIWHDDRGGLERLFADLPVQRIRVASLQDKGPAVDALVDGARDSGVGRRGRQALAELAEEMLVNAVLHAQRTSGEEKLDLDRRLPRSKEATLGWVVGERYIGVAVLDRAGALTGREVLSRVTGPIAGAGAELGAGMGLRIISQAVTHLFFAISPGAWCEILALVERGPRGRAPAPRTVCLLQALGQPRIALDDQQRIS